MDACKASMEHLHFFSPPESGNLLVPADGRSESVPGKLPGVFPLQLSSAELQDLQEGNVTSWLENPSEAAAKGTLNLAVKLPC